MCQYDFLLHSAVGLIWHQYSSIQIILNSRLSRFIQSTILNCFNQGQFVYVLLKSCIFFPLTKIELTNVVFFFNQILVNFFFDTKANENFTWIVKSDFLSLCNNFTKTYWKIYVYLFFKIKLFIIRVFLCDFSKIKKKFCEESVVKQLKLKCKKSNTREIRRTTE